MRTSTLLWIGIGVIVAIMLYRAYSNKKSNTRETANPTTPHPKQTPDISPEKKPLNSSVAKKAFLGNINRFISKLNSLCDGTYNENDWIDDIIDINNHDLIGFWKKCYRDENSVLRLLAMWGIAPDKCTSFVAMDYHKEMYELADNTPIMKGNTYKVKTPCWILTSSDGDGKTKKSIILKGKIE